MELYDYSAGGDSNRFLESIQAQDILKAMEAGLETGMQYNDQINNGGGLKVESLDPVLKVLENRLNQLVFLMEMPKQKITNTVHEYNQLYKYGQDVGIFNLEGETPQETDSQYRRKSIVTKFMGVVGQVTHPAMLVALAGGMNMYTKEVENKTVLLQTLIDQRLVDADSSKIDAQFDGVFRQHLTGINDIYGGMQGKTSEQALDAYFGDVAVINADGAVLNDALVEDAAQAVVNDRNGYIDRIISNPVVFNDYVKAFHESKRVIVGLGGSVTGATMGQSVNDITTQFGKVDVKNDKFFDIRTPRKLGTGKTFDKAPDAPIADTSTPIAVATDTKTKFGTAHAGTYFYAVAAVNRYGESALTQINMSAQAVTATQSVTLKFAAATSGSYPAEAFTIYRTVKDVTDASVAEFYPIFSVSVAELVAGYDGAGAGEVHDRNRIIAGTKSALVYVNDAQIMEYVQVADTMKMDFAITAPSRRFAILNYGTPVEYQPGKICRIVNIGRPGLV